MSGMKDTLGDTLFDAVTQRWRNTDPHTSKEAGVNADNFANEQHIVILRALNARSPMAAEQIADHVGLGGNVVPNWPTRRLSELERGGLVVPTDEIHKNRSGRSARKYRLTVLGKERINHGN